MKYNGKSKAADKVKEITEQLENGVQEVFTSARYIEYLQTMSRFYNYSARNCLLICLQCPGASYVAGFKAWEKFNRHVKKGAKAIKILAPIPCRITVEDEDGNEKEISFMKFRPASVFDISQTDGEPLPTVCERLTGNVDGFHELTAKLQSVAPVPIRFDNVPGSAAGYYSYADSEIVVQNGMDERQTVKTMVHEIAHAILHDRESGEQKDADRRTKEVQAESVAFTVCQYLGIDTAEYSFEYVATWASGRETKELMQSLDTIQKTARQIIEQIAA